MRCNDGLRFQSLSRYIVSYRKQGSTDWMTQTVHDNVISVPGLVPSTYYEFKIAGRNEFAHGDDSDIKEHQTKAGNDRYKC